LFFGEVTAMDTQGDNGTDHLDDRQLLAKESTQRDEFHRLEREQPQLRDTTYGPRPGTHALIMAWEQWWKTKLAARARGILSRSFGR
jgi:hypothetical protein